MTDAERKAQNKRFAALRGDLKDASNAKGTHKTYANWWKRWSEWCASEDISLEDGDGKLIEANPLVVATFLAVMAKTGNKGKPYATKSVNLARCAIGFYYRRAKRTDPTAHGEVETVMDGIRRTTTATVGQAKGLREADAEAIYRYLRQPQKSRRRRPAQRLLAAIMVARDGLFRVSELVGIRWEDVTWPTMLVEASSGLYSVDNASGNVFLRKSKTDQTGEGAYAHLSPATVEELDRWHRMEGRPNEGRIFAVSDVHMMAEIVKAAKGAGLGEGYRSHSIRIGMALDMRAAGLSLEDIRIAGRWRSTEMARLYLREDEVARNPVAKFHAKRGTA